MLEESADDIFKNAAETLKGLTPAPMNRMLERMAKERAIQKHEARKIMKTIDVPATGTGKSVSFSCAGVYFSAKGTLTAPPIQLIQVVAKVR